MLNYIYGLQGTFTKGNIPETSSEHKSLKKQYHDLEQMYENEMRKKEEEITQLPSSLKEAHAKLQKISIEC